MEDFTEDTDLEVYVKGHVTIHQFENLEDYRARRFTTILDKDNAVHKENMSIAIARAISDRPFGSIYYMAFGNGGAAFDPSGNVILNPPNVIGAANLYNQTYFEAVDDALGAPDGNFMDVRHINGSLYSNLDVVCTIGLNEPVGQLATDSVGDINISTEQFGFSEIGLKTEDNLLLTHITFTPVLKDAQRIFEVVYTLQITIN